METPLKASLAQATTKVALVLFSVILTLVSLLVLSQPAQASPLPLPDNTPVTVDGKNFYIVRSGKSYQVLNSETVASCFGGLSNVRIISGLSLYVLLVNNHFSGKVGCPVSYPNGRLLRTASKPEVYVKTNDKMYWVPNAETLLGCLGTWSDIKVINDTEMSWAMNAYPLSGTYLCPPKSYASGTLLQGSQAGVYLISDGKRLAMPSPEVLNCFGGWAGVTHVSDSEISLMVAHYPDGGTAACPYSLPDNSKLLYSGTVFVVRGGHTYGMPSAEVLNQCFGGWAGVRTIDSTEYSRVMQTYAYAGAGSCPYSLPNNSKVLFAGTVYFVTNGHTYGVPSPDVLNTCLGGWANVRTISQDEINHILAGYPYAGPAGCSAPQTGVREQRAIDWARAQIGSTSYNGWCERFIENAYGTTGRYASALAQANSKISRGTMHTGDRNVPVGAIAFFGSSKVNGYYGHVILSLGGGQFVSSGYAYNGRAYGVYVTGINETNMGPYLGWAYADDGWSR